MGTGKKASTKMQKHIRLSHVLVTSLAFRSLRSASVKVLVELCDRYNGSNNGTIHMGGGSTAKTLHMGKNSLYRALDDLIEKRLYRAHFRRGLALTKRRRISPNFLER